MGKWLDLDDWPPNKSHYRFSEFLPLSLVPHAAAHRPRGPSFLLFLTAVLALCIMVSALWKASSEGDLDNVLVYLQSATGIDIEIKDHTGATPLIEAVKNGHTEIVRVLLDHGADPSNASSHGLPEQFTTEQAILDLIRDAQNKMHHHAVAPAEYPQDHNMDPSKQYYPPPGAYYYPGMPPVAPLPEGAVAYYPPMPPQSAPGEHANGNGNNLPPPDIARMIPCRYYPACRYGASCMFLHPQAPYFQGPMPPPAQYPAPYDPYQPNYYAVVPPSFPPPNGVPMSPTSPHGGSQHTPPHMGHSRSSSEVIPPPQGQFSPPVVPYGAVSPLSPAYPHPGGMPIPVSIPPLPPLNHSVPPPPPGPQSPTAMYQNGPPPPAPFAVQFPPHQGTPPVPEQNGGPKSPTMQPQTDGYPQPPMHREGMTHHRRQSLRKPSFGGGRKPPCLFFPAGRCRNGDECRFPHVLPDGNGPQVYPHYAPPMPRGPPRPRHFSNAANGIASIEEKMAGMNVREVGLER
ncbi:hypothetical protein OE88DRAFT_34052 [Heliocybe sulcata]|uniref:C3H1-type domain-containing protein n=1 Tax=Heliocybe sulcata TaxID=5364 RepID=A0A5C3NF93_9AGAM|nr:hypothetical protein OE88DRAFT_34052 [Heliocybe sulcata]